MSGINWQQFGLKESPYETKPLTEGGDLPINKAFIGRDSELQYLSNLFSSNTNLCLIVSGEVGVGKTSLINFHKYQLKHIEKDRPLFSFRREIEASPETLSKRFFLLDIIGSVLREIQLIDSKMINNVKELKKLQKIVDISMNLNFSAGFSGGFESIQAGVDFGRGSSTEQPIQMPLSILEQYFYDLVTYLKKTKIGGKRYHGLIVHVNNFDSLLYDKANKNKLIAFFHEIRDLLQTKHVYFVFLGPRNFYRDVIATQKRIKGIFVPSPLMVDSLSKEELVQAFDERLKIFKSDKVSTIIKPFESSVIYKLYDLYEGDIRSIMSALMDILGQYSFRLGKTLSVDEALILLGRERWERIESTANLTPEQTEILKYFASTNDFVTQKDLAQLLSKTKESLSGYYFKALKENGIIEEKKKIGTTKYWGLTDEYVPIRFILDYKNTFETNMKSANEQLKLV